MVEPPQCANTTQKHATQTVFEAPQSGVAQARDQVTEQNSQAQAFLGMPGPARRSQRADQGTQAAGSEQQAHTQHAAALRIDTVPAHREVTLAHHGEEHPTGADHQFARLGENRGQQTAIATHVAYAFENRGVVPEIVGAQRRG